MGTWLPLTEYSTKYRVSMSTLRRRIKAEDIQFRFSDGKYFIMDEPISTSSHRPSLSVMAKAGSEHHRPSRVSEDLDPVYERVTRAGFSEESSKAELQMAKRLEEGKRILAQQARLHDSTQRSFGNDSYGTNKNVRPNYGSSSGASNFEWQERNITRLAMMEKSNPEKPAMEKNSFAPTSVNQSSSTPVAQISQVTKDEPILTAANKLLTELKKAYSQILHEKEEQILHLKEEVSDLKTLVKVLESDNLRLKDLRR